MASGRASPVLNYLRTLLPGPGPEDGSDARLLERFVALRDAEAFAALVRRHGPLVWGVCRRGLRHEADAEDAFQATFLALARRASAIGRRDLLAGWLHGVACRTAARARAEAARRRAREARAPAAAAVPPDEGVLWRDLRPVLDEEVRALPARYREAFVLCHLEGVTNREAARRLGCPEGTVVSRLAWARQRLRARLARRGLAPTAGVLATALAQDMAPAAVPAPLAAAAARSATSAGTGPAAPGAVPAQVAALTEGVLKTMSLGKAKLAALFALVVLVAVSAGGVLAVRPAAVPAPPADREAGARQARRESALRVEIRLPRAHFRPGEPIPLTITYFNTTRQPLTLMANGSAEGEGFPGETFVVVRDGTRHAYTVNAIDPAVRKVPIKAGGSWRRTIKDLSEELSRPGVTVAGPLESATEFVPPLHRRGEYTLRLRYDHTVQGPPRGVFGGSVESNVVRFRIGDIKPDDPTKDGRRPAPIEGIVKATDDVSILLTNGQRVLFNDHTAFLRETGRGTEWIGLTDIKPGLRVQIVPTDWGRDMAASVVVTRLQPPR